MTGPDGSYFWTRDHLSCFLLFATEDASRSSVEDQSPVPQSSLLKMSVGVVGISYSLRRTVTSMDEFRVIEITDNIVKRGPFCLRRPPVFSFCVGSYITGSS